MDSVAVTEIINRALRLVSQSGAPGRGNSPEQVTEVLDYLNQFLDSWNALRDSLYQVRISTHELTPSQETYTIGPSGDFVQTRPIDILRANILLTSEDDPVVRYPLALLNWDQWSQVRVPELATTLPQYVYFDNAYPDRTIYLWGYPTVNNTLEIFEPLQLDSSLASNDTLLLPPGYMRAIVYGLAVEIRPLYADAMSKEQVSRFALVDRIARESRAAIAAHNSEAPLLYNDAAPMNGNPRTPYFLYRTGNL